MPPLEVGQRSGLVRLEPKQHFTQPPPRYTEALAGEGAGGEGDRAAVDLRPDPDRRSRSASTSRRTRGALSPTELGETVNDLLVKAFPDIFEVAFTAQMEESLDEIEEGDRKWVETVREFYKPFAADLKQAGIDMEDLKKGKPTDETCPTCGEGKLLEKWGRFGRFLACERYPDCKYTRNLGESAQAEPEQAGITCDKCGKPMVFKQSKLRALHRLLGIPRVQEHQEDHHRHPVPAGGLRGRADRAALEAGPRVLRLRQLSDVPLRRLAAPGRDPVPEVRRAVPDAARRARKALRRVLARGLRLPARAESA